MIGRHCDGIQAIELLVKIVIDPMLEPPRPHVEMEIRRSQVQVHQNRPESSPGQVNADVGRQDGFSDTPFGAAYGNDPTWGRWLISGWGRGH
jgi:hypothetical protein